MGTFDSVIELWKTTAAQRILAQAGPLPRADADRVKARQTFAPWARGVGRRARPPCPHLAGAVPLKSWAREKERSRTAGFEIGARSLPCILDALNKRCGAVGMSDGKLALFSVQIVVKTGESIASFKNFLG